MALCPEQTLTMKTPPHASTGMATGSSNGNVDWLMSSPPSSVSNGDTINGTGWLLSSSPSADSSKPREAAWHLDVDEPVISWLLSPSSEPCDTGFDVDSDIDMEDSVTTFHPGQPGTAGYNSPHRPPGREEYSPSHNLRDPSTERDMEVDAELPPSRNDPHPEDLLISDDVFEQLKRITTTITQLHQFIVENLRVTDARLTALDDSIRVMNTSRSAELDDNSQHAIRPIVRLPKKDSSANYARRCIRKHMKLTFGFNRTDALPEAPSPEEVRGLLRRVNRGESLPKPYRVDWTNTATSVYNVCVENAFCADFWASAIAGQYDINLIPAPYQDREGFIKLYRRHLAHLRKCWVAQQDPPLESEKVAKAKHYARNSRIGTTFRNRRDAARYLPPPDSAKVFNLIKEVGTVGISSDEEIPSLPGQGRQYATYDKPWRAQALVHLYRHMDLIHAATRNPNGNPIRVRHRTLRVRQSVAAPKGLPIDCYDSLFLNRCTPLDIQVLRPRPPVGVDELWMRVQAHGMLMQYALQNCLRLMSRSPQFIHHSYHPDLLDVIYAIRRAGQSVRIFPGFNEVASVNRQLFIDLDEVRRQRLRPIIQAGTVPLPAGVAGEQRGKQARRQTTTPRTCGAAERGEAVQRKEASVVDGELWNDAITCSKINDEVAAPPPELTDSRYRRPSDATCRSPRAPRARPSNSIAEESDSDAPLGKQYHVMSCVPIPRMNRMVIVLRITLERRLPSAQVPFVRTPGPCNWCMRAASSHGMDLPEVYASGAPKGVAPVHEGSSAWSPYRSAYHVFDQASNTMSSSGLRAYLATVPVMIKRDVNSCNIHRTFTFSAYTVGSTLLPSPPKSLPSTALLAQTVMTARVTS
ncbi:hypothetical protein C8Q76DRAFT_688603 [Earliella scabrosa]|nr:hypothetical protein C8Q76DRAFT_688603 [Earliella scabrosa]